MRTLFLALILFLPGCSVIDALKETAQQTNELVKTTKDLVNTTKAEFAKAKTAADTNKDGKTTLNEWWIYLLGLLGIGGAGVIRNGRSNERKARTEGKLDAIEERVGKIEGATAPRSV